MYGVRWTKNGGPACGGEFSNVEIAVLVDDGVSLEGGYSFCVLVFFEDFLEGATFYFEILLVVVTCFFVRGRKKGRERL